jgi:hypothetical protein
LMTAFMIFDIPIEGSVALIIVLTVLQVWNYYYFFGKIFFLLKPLLRNKFYIRESAERVPDFSYPPSAMKNRPLLS